MYSQGSRHYKKKRDRFLPKINHSPIQAQLVLQSCSCHESLGVMTVSQISKIPNSSLQEEFHGDTSWQKCFWFLHQAHRIYLTPSGSLVLAGWMCQSWLQGFRPLCTGISSTHWATQLMQARMHSPAELLQILNLSLLHKVFFFSLLFIAYSKPKETDFSLEKKTIQDISKRERERDLGNWFLKELKGKKWGGLY